MRLIHWLVILGPTVALLAVIGTTSPNDFYRVQDIPEKGSQHATDKGFQPDTAGANGDGNGAGAPPADPQPSASEPIMDAFRYVTPWKDSNAPHDAVATPVALPQAAPPRAANSQTARQPAGIGELDQPPAVRFSGVVQQVSEFNQRDGQLHLWIHDGQDKEMEISLAPSWFLEYIGCPVRHNEPVSGTGFVFDTQAGDQLVYVKKITIGSKVCRLRNDEGFALWSSRLQ